MKLKYLLIVLIITLVAVLLLTSMNEEEKYCDQFSGKTGTEELSSVYLECEAELRCKAEIIGDLDTEADEKNNLEFSCIPNDRINNPPKNSSI